MYISPNRTYHGFSPTPPHDEPYTVLATDDGLNTNDGQVAMSTEHTAASDGNGANCHVLL